jgi:5-hydroxyisourate hydrolase-like protein (transthyretin family)
MGPAVLAACLYSVIASHLAASAPTAGQPGSAGQVAGRVIDGISGAPVAGVTVTLLPTMFPAVAANALQAVTDENGSFAFQRLTPGRYRLQAQKIGFAALAGPFDERTLDVAAGQSIAGLALALRPGATMTGRVLDANGAPAFALTVSALRRAPGPDGRQIATTAQMAQTNERGEFQMSSLPDGQYLVIAAPMPPPPFSAPSDAVTVMSPTYYPGTADPASAQAITLALAETMTGVQFAMVTRAAHQISGTVVDGAGSPVAHAIVMLRIDPRRGGGPVPAAGLTDETGAFRIGGLVAGTYQITIGGNSLPSGPVQGGFGRAAVGGVMVAGAASASSATAVTPSEITIGDADVSGLTIALTTSR